MLETVLFTDHDLVAFVITTNGVALIFSVLGLARPPDVRRHQVPSKRVAVTWFLGDSHASP